MRGERSQPVPEALLLRPKGSTESGLRPTLLTTAALHDRASQALQGMRPLAHKGLIVVLPKDNLKMSARLLAIGRDYERRGGTIALVDEEGGEASVLGFRRRLSQDDDRLV